MPITPRDMLRTVAPGHLHQFLASEAERPTQDDAESVGHLWPPRKQEPGNDDGEKELKQPQECALSDLKQLPSDRLDQW